MKIDYQNNTYEDLLDFKAQGKAWPIIKKASDAGVFQLIHENATYGKILKCLSDDPEEAALILDVLTECGLLLCGADWICNASLAEQFLMHGAPDLQMTADYIESQFQKLCGDAKVQCITKMDDAILPNKDTVIAFLGIFENDYGLPTALARLEAYENGCEFPVFSAEEIRQFCSENHLVCTDPVSVTGETSAVFVAADPKLFDQLTLTLEQRVMAALKKLDIKSVTPISPEDVVIAPWVHDHCRFGCSSYGDKHCPPHSPDSRQTLTKIQDYQSALLIEGIPPTRSFQQLMLHAEKIAFKAGYYRAFAYWAGPCCICTECKPPASPKACTVTRPSMESAGIDVFATVRKLGFQLETRKDQNEYVKYFGLLLLE